MANEELGKLSPEQIQKLAGTISEAKSLTSQQEEIIKRVLDGEIEIGNTRIASLERFFDIYSRNLDLIARKHSSLNDAFLILESKLIENYKTLSSDVSELERQVSSIRNHDRDSQKSDSPKKDGPRAGQKNSSAETSDTDGKVSQKTAKTNTKALLDTALGMLADSYKKESEARLRAISSGNSAMLELEKQYQEQRYSQLKQHLDQLASISRLPTATSAPGAGQSIDTAGRLTGELVENTAENDTLDIASLGTQPYINNSSSIIGYKPQPPSTNDEIPAPPANRNPGNEEATTEPVEVRQTVSRFSRAELPSVHTESEDAIKSVFEYITTIEKAREARAELDEALASGDRARIKIAGAAYNELKKRWNDHLKALEEQNKVHLKELNDQDDEAREKYLRLELAKSQTQEQQAIRLTEIRLRELNRFLDAEIEAQNALNQIDLQINPAQTESDAELELNSLRTRSINADVDLQAAKELEKQIAEYRAKLNYEAMSRSNGILTEEDAAANEEKLREYFADYESRLEHIKELNVFAQENPQAAEALAKRKADFIAREEYKARKKHNGRLEAEERARIQRLAEEEYELTAEMREKLEKEQLEAERKNKKSKQAQGDQAFNNFITAPLTKENNLIDRFEDIGTMIDKSDNKIAATFAVATKAISDLAAQLDTKIDQIASYQGDIDTRLQGSNNKTNFAGSYWGQLTKDMMSVGAVTPFFKQEDFANNIKSLVDKGISFDLKQRAFLMTIQEKIANTFDVADGTLLRLIRIQQEDSTAGRLGMESALNSFLNEMYETSEYLTDVANSVRGSLEEMEALMSGAEATEVEFQVQKWMGSLYSVGMSQEAVQSIASALGQIAAGQVDALTNGGGAGNLMVMAANEAGLTISDILTKGLDAAETNKLLQATVNYLAELAESSKDNQVVQQQLANVFGVKASDLRAATNLATNDTTSDVFGSYLTYDNMLKQLNNMAGTMFMRTSIGEMMTNIWDNGQYTLASSMANNPVSYLMFKMADLLEKTTGGISLPFLNVYGFGVDLETTVADLMRVASMGTGILGSLGPMISGLASSFSGQAMLSTMGIEQGSGLKVTPRGNGASIGASETAGGGAQTTSGSGYVGNASSSDVKDSTIQESEDSKKQQMIEAKEEAEATQFDIISMNVLKIYELLDEVTNGKRNFNVKVSGYGLTNLGNNTALSGAQGGVAGLLSNSPANNSSNGNSLGGNSSNTGGSAPGGNNTSGSSVSFGSGTGLDLGGWTMH